MEEIKLKNNRVDISYDWDKWIIKWNDDNEYIYDVRLGNTVELKDGLIIHDLFTNDAYIEEAYDHYDIYHNGFDPQNLMKKYLFDDEIKEVNDFMEHEAINNMGFYELDNADFINLGIDYDNRKNLMKCIKHIERRLSRVKFE